MVCFTFLYNAFSTCVQATGCTGSVVCFALRFSCGLAHWLVRQSCTLALTCFLSIRGRVDCGVSKSSPACATMLGFLLSSMWCVLPGTLRIIFHKTLFYFPAVCTCMFLSIQSCFMTHASFWGVVRRMNSRGDQEGTSIRAALLYR